MIFRHLTFGMPWRRVPVSELLGNLIRVSPERFVECLSIRTGFDSLLSLVDWPADSEILMSAITIADMPRIVRTHGYRPVPLDVSPHTLAPSLDEIRTRLTPRTRALVLTHLAGGGVEMAQLKDVCRGRGLMIIDDRAQAFVGTQAMIQSSRDADVSMWSFGSIKTATALGGAMFSVRDSDLRERMQRSLGQRPVQSRWLFARRIVKYAMIRFACRPLPAAGIVNAFRILGADHDRFAAELTRGFAGSGFFERIRHRPSLPLQQLLLRRLATYDEHQIERRRLAGQQLVRELDGVLPVLGDEMIDPTFWFFGVLADRPEQLVRSLWRAGFDATNRSSLRRVGGKQEDPAFVESANAEDAMIADKLLKHMVLLPVSGEMPAEEIRRMAQVVRQSGAEPPRWFIELTSASKPAASSEPRVRPTSPATSVC